MVDMLSPLQPLCNDVIGSVEFFLVQGDALPGFGQKRPVFRLGRIGTVVISREMAGRGMLLGATIAYVGCAKQLRACALFGDKAVAMLAPVMFDLIRDRRWILADQPSDVLECHPFAQAFFNLLTVLAGQVLVLLGFVFGLHDVVSFLGSFSQI